MKMHYLFIIMLFLIPGSGCSTPHPKGNIFVDALNGNDANPGDTPDRAVKTFEVINNSKFHPGDTIFLRSGSVWYEKIRLSSGGSRKKPVVITSYGSGAKPVIDGQKIRDNNIYIYKANFVEVSNLDLKNAVGEGSIRIAYGKEIVIKNCDFLITGHGAVLIENSNDCIITGNFITSPSGMINAQTDGIYSQRNNKIRIENNKIILRNDQPDQHLDGIQSYLDQDITISGNFIYQDNLKTNSQGIYTTNAQGRHIYYNNIVYCPNTLASVVGFRNLDKGYGSLELYNNTLKSRGSNNLYITEAEYVKAYNNIFITSAAAYIINLTSRIKDPLKSFNHNLYFRNGDGNIVNYPAAGGGMTFKQWQSEGFDQQSIMADPKLDNDLNLTTGSPAIDAGENIKLFNNDFKGADRKKGKTTDIGAVEYSK